MAGRGKRQTEVTVSGDATQQEAIRVNIQRPGAVQISKLGKNFFRKVYLYDIRDNLPSDLGPKTQKCIF